VSLRIGFNAANTTKILTLLGLELRPSPGGDERKKKTKLRRRDGKEGGKKKETWKMKREIRTEEMRDRKMRTVMKAASSMHGSEGSANNTAASS
jgi:hypothetical protein